MQLDDQEGILENLIKNDNIFSLAKQISKYGFVPVEKMVVLKQKNNKYIVLEGNRRLAALKCLDNPNLAQKPKLIEDFENLRGSSFAVRKIPVFIAPSRREALAKFIIPKHTEPSVEKWATYNKAKLYAKIILDQEENIDNVCKIFNLKKDSILEFLRMYQCYKIATKLSLDHRIMEKVLDERKFPITTLDRFIKFQEGQRFLGITFDENGELKGKIKKEEFLKGYRKIIFDLAEENQTSRTLGKKGDITSYIKSFKQNETPDLEKRGNFTFTSFKQPKQSANRTSTKSKINKKKLDDYQFSISLQSSIIDKIYEEIKNVNFNNKPYSFAILFRSFLHVCCLQYARDTNIFQDIKGENNSKNRHGEDPTLGDCLNFFKNENTFQDNSVKKSIGKFLNKQHSHSMTTLNTLNILNHSNTETIEGKLHSEMLNTLEQFLRSLFKGSKTGSQRFFNHTQVY